MNSKGSASRRQPGHGEHVWGRGLRRGCTSRDHVMKDLGSPARMNSIPKAVGNDWVAETKDAARWDCWLEEEVSR